LFHEFHEYIWVVLTVVVVGHTAAALKHHLVAKNDVLRRMWRY
jgi:cytochrome b561